MLGPWIESWLGEFGLNIEQVGSWAVHPGGPRILEACAAAIASSEGSGGSVTGQSDGGTAIKTQMRRSTILVDSEAVLAEYGNMSSPTVLFILDRLRKREATRPFVALAFGPGVAIEAALLR